ncbi:hypothetical protein ES702_00604 [subsurface metagenome]
MEMRTSVSLLIVAMLLKSCEDDGVVPEGLALNTHSTRRIRIRALVVSCILVQIISHHYRVDLDNFPQ